jgi:hypothetical protein
MSGLRPRDQALLMIVNAKIPLLVGAKTMPCDCWQVSVPSMLESMTWYFGIQQIVEQSCQVETQARLELRKNLVAKCFVWMARTCV